MWSLLLIINSYSLCKLVSIESVFLVLGIIYQILFYQLLIAVGIHGINTFSKIFEYLSFSLGFEHVILDEIDIVKFVI